MYASHGFTVTIGVNVEWISVKERLHNDVDIVFELIKKEMGIE